mmetsp:Transcript_7775/g.8796  ORF Transcript_7775/g.8796 Transcript_7775/m.8796 type:complete len:88 (+) Transcript_7775:407-670(+)
MDDNIDVEPNTLSSCEKFHLRENIWTNVEPLNVPRAYAGVVCFPTRQKPREKLNPKDPNKLKASSSFIYVFGGLNNFVALDCIEKYD